MTRTQRKAEAARRLAGLGAARKKANAAVKTTAKNAPKGTYGFGPGRVTSLEYPRGASSSRVSPRRSRPVSSTGLADSAAMLGGLIRK